jgi:hypothetical protein
MAIKLILLRVIKKQHLFLRSGNYIRPKPNLENKNAGRHKVGYR